MAKLTEEELRRLHEINLSMAKVFVEFCNKHGLTCYLCGGGCIGAIRHKGIIPWDDDLDFFMPRRDYEKCYRLWKEEMQSSRYPLVLSDRNGIDRNIFFTIRDRETTYIKPYQKDLDIVHGVPLDVLPIDGYAPGKFARKMQCFWALIYSLYCAQTVPQNHGKLVALAGKIALGVVPFKALRYKLWKFAEKKMIKYDLYETEGMTELCSGPGYMKNWYPAAAFRKSVFVDFEDTKMPIPEGYDEYLRIAFGDYMKLPPKEKQIGHHEAWFMDLDTPYTEYKGKYYCVNERNG